MPDKASTGTRETRESFIPQEDRPAVGIGADTPLTELRVRDLASILHLGSRKDFWDGKSWQKDDFDNVNWFHDYYQIRWKHKEKEKEFKEKAEKEIYEGPGGEKVYDPRINQLMQSIAGLTQQVSQLANHIEQLQKERSR